METAPEATPEYSSLRGQVLKKKGGSAEQLQQKLRNLPEKMSLEMFENNIANIPKSSFSDNYAEFGSAGARKRHAAI